MATSAMTVWRDRVSFVLINRILPVGFFAFLTGMFWVGQHGRFPPLFHAVVALPALLLIAIQPKSLVRVLDSRIVVAYMPLACYMVASLLWSSTEESAMDMVKRPLLVLLLFVAFHELGRWRFDLLRLTVKSSAIFAAVAALVTVGRFLAETGHARLAGYGALYNPLLVAHVFGFFMALWLGIYFAERKLFEPLSIVSILTCGILLLATGSRTPLVAVVATILWLAALSANKKSVVAVCGLLVLCGAILLFSPEVITQRGLSYRNEIWANVLQQIAEKPWLGHGYGTPLQVKLAGLPYTLSDPHNLTLSVLYVGGIVGFLLWLSLYVVALLRSWALRGDGWVLACSATVVYGLASGMTEGGSFLSRPREHWFLIWIPFALLSAVAYRGQADGQTK